MRSNNMNMEIDSKSLLNKERAQEPHKGKQKKHMKEKLEQKPTQLEDIEVKLSKHGHIEGHDLSKEQRNTVLHPKQFQNRISPHKAGLPPKLR